MTTALHTSEIISRLQALKPLLHNASNKPAKRLRHSCAVLEFEALMARLPGSMRRGIERGNIEL